MVWQKEDEEMDEVVEGGTENAAMNEDSLMENWEQLKSDLSCLQYPDTPDYSDGSDTYDISYEDTSDDSDEGILVEGRGIHVEIDIYNKCCLALAFDFDIDKFTLKNSMKFKCKKK